MSGGGRREGGETYLFLDGIVRVGFSALDELDGVFVELLEVVRGVRERIAFDPHECQILDDGFFELGLAEP